MPELIENKESLLEPRSFLENVGERFNSAALEIGGISNLAIKAISGIFKYKLEGKEIERQLMLIGNRSTSIVFLIAFFTGLVIALQLIVGLGRFGLKTYVGQVVGLAVFRELGPVLTALMVAARVGSGVAAELGSMAVTEQVLAIEAMGASPMQKLVVPRVIATTIAMPILVVMADIIGVVGGMVITMKEAGVSARFYVDQIRNTIIIDDFVSGIAKAAFFGFFIAIIACYEGLQTKGGTEGVGRSTTRAVVFASITIFVSDFFLTKIILYF